MFNFEGSLPDNIAHHGRFKPNYPLLFPKFTIKLSIKSGSDFSSSLSLDAAELHQRSGSLSSRKKETLTDRCQTQGCPEAPPPRDPAAGNFPGSKKHSAIPCCRQWLGGFNSERCPQFVTPIPGCKNWSLTGSAPWGANLGSFAAFGHCRMHLFWGNSTIK